MYTEEQIKLNREKYIQPTESGRGYYYLVTTELSGEPDKWLYQRQFDKLLAKLNFHYQDWFDKFILGLSSRSERPRCLNCNKETTFIYRGAGFYQQFCCKECYKEYSQTSDEYKDNMSKSVREVQSGDDYHNLHSARVRNGITDEVKSRMSESHTGVKFTEEHRKHLSESVHKSWENSKLDGSYLGWCKSISDSITPDSIHNTDTGYNTGYVEVLKCLNKSLLRFKSSYEQYWIHKLEEDDKVLNYLWEPYSICYYYDGYDRKYYPDCIVTYSDGHIEMQEIKPSTRIDEPKNQAKAQAAIKYCSEHNMTYRFITEDDIF